METHTDTHEFARSINVLRLDDLTDEEWEIISRLIRRSAKKNARSWWTLRRSVDGILWRMRTGEPWRFVPSEYGNGSSICRRFQLWSSSGEWSRITSTLAEMRAGRTVANH